MGVTTRTPNRRRPLPGEPGATPQPWAMPPLIKVYEALGAVADGRVELVDERRAVVCSSDGSKTYEVESDGQVISANDNASYWQGYLGYPGIAVLLARELYRAPANVIDALAEIPWKELNRKYRNDYAKSLADVERQAEANGHDPDAIRSEAEAILAFLKKLAPVRGKRSRPPR